MEINKKTNLLLDLLLIIVLTILLSEIVMASSGWYTGTLHVHTGFSTYTGYDSDENTESDNCPEEILTEVKKETGRNVSYLKDQAKNQFGLSWQSYTDHSYCLESSELQTVKADCDAVDGADPDFTCLSGEELSVHDGFSDFEPLCAGFFQLFSGAHLGANGISSYMMQYPLKSYCPLLFSAQDGIGEINRKSGVSIIHHPVTDLSWDFESINKVSGEDGIEVWNGNWNNVLIYNQKALNLWINYRLLKGIQSYAFSGTDTHGDAVGEPYQTVYLTTLDSGSLKTGLKSGRHSASNNGYFDLSIGNVNMGSLAYAIHGSSIQITVNHLIDISSCNFKLIKGVVKEKEEIIDARSLSSFSLGSFVVSDTITKNSYYRAECISNDGSKRIISNPIWVNVRKQITITNNGDDALTVTSVSTGKNWATVSPTSFTGVNKIPAGQSRTINITIDAFYLNSRLSGKNKETFNVQVKSDDPDEPVKNIPVTVDIKRYIHLFSSTDIASLEQGEMYEANMPMEFKETENFEVSLDWSTDDDLDLIITDPDGTNHTATDGHPENITIVNPINGTWLIWVNATTVEDNVTFTVTAKPYSSDTANESISYKDTRLNYVSTCSQQEQGLKTVMRSIKAGVGETSINITNATNQALDAFMVGLLIPNHKQFVALQKGAVDIHSTFARTETAQILLEADVKLKSADKQEWVKVINDSYNYWDSLISGTSYYSKITSQTDWYYPEFAAYRNIVPEIVLGNGTIIDAENNSCSIFLTNITFDVVGNITVAYLDYSDWGLTSEEVQDIESKLVIWRDYIQNLSENNNVPALKSYVNNNANFSDFRRVASSLALAQWYKTLDKNAVLFGDLIDTENITALDLNVSYNETYWIDQSNQYLYAATLNLPSGNFNKDWWGGITLGNFGVTIEDYIAVDTYYVLDDAIKKSVQNVSDTYYHSETILSQDPDLKPITLYFSSATPEVNRSMNITTIIKNNGLTNASNFKVYFKYEHTFPNGYVLVDDITSETVANLGSGETATITKEWTPYELGEFTVSVETDGDYGVKESNELNNERAETFEVEGSEPVVTIISPLAAAELYAYQNITFNGTAVDPQEGTINGTSLVWTSSKDGQLGTGEAVYKNLSLGDHVITLNATDAEGFVGSAQVNVTVVFGVAEIKEVDNEEDNVSGEKVGSQNISVYPNELCFDCEVNEDEI